MPAAKRVGQTIGAMMLARGLLAPPVYFAMLPPVTGRDYLATAAASALQIRVGVMLAFLLGALTLAIGIVATPLCRRHSERMALAFLALSVAAFATLATDNVGILTLLSLSQEYARAGGTNDVLETVGRMARSMWRAAHFTNLMVGHATGLVLNVILYRFALVPRVLAGFGVAAALVSAPAVTLPLLGYRFSALLVMPAALTQLALVAWLLVRGFEERRPARADDPAPLELARP